MEHATNSQINRNINRIRRDIRLWAVRMQAKIDADEDCTSEARALMHAQADLRLFLQRREEVAA